MDSRIQYNTGTIAQPSIEQHPPSLMRLQQQPRPASVVHSSNPIRVATAVDLNGVPRLPIASYNNPVHVWRPAFFPFASFTDSRQHHVATNASSTANVGTNNIDNGASIRDLSPFTRNQQALAYLDFVTATHHDWGAANNDVVEVSSGVGQDAGPNSAAEQREHIIKAVTDRIITYNQQQRLQHQRQEQHQSMFPSMTFLSTTIPNPSDVGTAPSDGGKVAGVQQFTQSPSPARDLERILVDSNEDVLEILGKTCMERRIQKAPYFDASTLNDPNPIIAASKRARGGVTEPFPEKLYRILMDAKSQGFEDIVSFYPHGRAFGIHSPERFATQIMPKYFKQSSRLSSFRRQLNLYGFARINTGSDAGGYYHELFLRGRPALSTHIQRAGVTKGAPRRRGVKAHHASIDPDLYSLPQIQPSSCN